MKHEATNLLFNNGQRSLRFLASDYLTNLKIHKKQKQTNLLFNEQGSIAEQDNPVLDPTSIAIVETLANSIEVSFSAATDASSPVTYTLYSSQINNIATVEDAEANGTEQGSNTDASNIIATNGIIEDTLYYLTVVAKDPWGNKTSYNVVNDTTPIAELSATYEVRLQAVNPDIGGSAQINLVSESQAAILQTGGGDFDVEVSVPEYVVTAVRQYWNTFDSGQAAIDENFNSGFVARSRLDDALGAEYDVDNTEAVIIPPNTDGNCPPGSENDSVSVTIPAYNSARQSLDNIVFFNALFETTVTTPSNSSVCSLNFDVTFTVTIYGLTDVFNIRDNLDSKFNITVNKIS